MTPDVPGSRPCPPPEDQANLGPADLAPEGLLAEIGWSLDPTNRAWVDGLASLIVSERGDPMAPGYLPRLRAQMLVRIILGGLRERVEAAKKAHQSGSAPLSPEVFITDAMLAAALDVLDQRGWLPPNARTFGSDVRDALAAALAVRP